ncbi:hypothetical protein PRIPAC_72638, partial [Pristionchus pacificus]
RIEEVRVARSATRGAQPEEDEANFDRRSWPLIPDGCRLEDVFNLPRVPRGTITLGDDYVRREGSALPRCVVIDAEDMLIRGTGYERGRIGNQQFDPACLFSWLRYLLKSNFMVVAICSPAYLTPMQTLYPELLKMLAQYGLMDFPLELLDPRNTYRILETAKRVGGIVLTTNTFKEHHDDEAVKELAESIIVAPDYVTTKIKDSEWFFKTRDGNHWLSYYCPQFLERQLTKPSYIRGRLFCSPGHPCYEITSKYRKTFTDLRRDKLIAILDCVIMERIKTPCAFVKPQRSKASKLRVQLMKELEMQLSVNRWRELIKDVKYQRARERAELEAKKEWATRLKHREEAIKKRDLYRDAEMERWREQYRRRAARQQADREVEVFDLVADGKSKVLRRLKYELDRQTSPPEIDDDESEQELWQNLATPRRRHDSVLSKTYSEPPVHKDPTEYIELFFKWYNMRLKRHFREQKRPSPEELAQYRITQDLPKDREMWPFDRKQFFELGTFFFGRHRRGGLDWTRKEVDEGELDDLRVGPFMSKKKYVAF